MLRPSEFADLLFGDAPDEPKKKKSKKVDKAKRRDQEKSKKADVIAVTSGVTVGVSAEIAPVIPLFGPRKII